MGKEGDLPEAAASAIWSRVEAASDKDGLWSRAPPTTFLAGAAVDGRGGAVTRPMCSLQAGKLGRIRLACDPTTWGLQPHGAPTPRLKITGIVDAQEFYHTSHSQTTVH